jgi:hypothetical protein
MFAKKIVIAQVYQLIMIIAMFFLALQAKWSEMTAKAFFMCPPPLPACTAGSVYVQQIIAHHNHHCVGHRFVTETRVEYSDLEATNFELFFKNLLFISVVWSVVYLSVITGKPVPLIAYKRYK